MKDKKMVENCSEREEVTPLLSVIVPVHDVEKYLRRCVESLAAQSVASRMEVIMVENGSRDGSLAECRRLAEEYPFVRVLVSGVLGPSAARNMGMDEARGDVIGFLDADDFIDPDMFGRLLAAMDEAQADAAYCNYMLEYEDGTVRYPFADTGEVYAMRVSDVVYDIIMEKSTSSPCVRVCRSCKLAGCRFPVGVFYEDHDVIYRWMAGMDRIVHVDVPFYHYCIRSGSTTQTTIGGTSKTRDYFNADLRRIPFIKGYGAFSRRQRNELLRHVVRCTLSHIKGYIMAVGDADADNSELADMRVRLLEETNGLSPMTVGLDSWIKLLRMRVGWNGYFRHYRKRARRG